jgi:hypothetical protein
MDRVSNWAEFFFCFCFWVLLEDRVESLKSTLLLLAFRVVAEALVSLGILIVKILMYSQCHVDANAMVTSWIPRTLLLNYEKIAKIGIY